MLARDGGQACDLIRVERGRNRRELGMLRLASGGAHEAFKIAIPRDGQLLGPAVDSTR